MNPQPHRFTLDLPENHLKLLKALAAARGWSAGQYLRQLLADHLVQLEQEQEATP